MSGAPTPFWATPPNHVSSQNANQARNLGMTSAISLAMPRPNDLQRTKELDEGLKPHGVSETDEELNHRSVTLLYYIFVTFSTVFISVVSEWKSLEKSTNWPKDGFEMFLCRKTCHLQLQITWGAKFTRLVLIG